MWRFGTLGDFVEFTNQAEQRESTEIRLRVGEEKGRRLTNLLTQTRSRANGCGVHTIVLEPDGYHWSGKRSACQPVRYRIRASPAAAHEARSVGGASR